MARRPIKKTINLALQGGGALGAYSWGVLDRILEDERIEIAAVSGASAGAMNGVVMCEGMMEAGREGARTALRHFWEGVARRSSPYGVGALDAWFNRWTSAIPGADTFNPFSMMRRFASGLASPYDFNPLNINPLKDLLSEMVDFELVRSCDQVELFVTATNVETGRARIFTRRELTADHVIASACLPLLFHAVEIEGEFYWDGGYMGNPALFPLFDVAATCDILIVQINPIERPGEPRTAEDIKERMIEITFNASLLRELRAIEFVGRLLDEGRLDDSHYRKMLIHVVADDAALLPLRTTGAADLAQLEKLFTVGRMACDHWLDAHYRDLGRRSTVDLRRMFEGELGPVTAAPGRRPRAGG